MITAAVATDPIAASSSASANYRARQQVPGERTLLPQSTPPVPSNTTASDNGSFPRPAPQIPQPAPEPERYGAASMFAAAVIAGNMPPVPTTMEELVMRIGSIPLPPEAEARLKDLIA